MNMNMKINLNIENSMMCAHSGTCEAVLRLTPLPLTLASNLWAQFLRHLS